MAAESVDFHPFTVLRQPDGLPIELGRGGMGVTYKAMDETLGRPVALKVIAGLYLDHPTVRKRFLSEARAAAHLNHPNVASVFHLRTEGSPVFYAMEYVEGDTAEALVERRGALSVRLALRIVLQAAQGLAAAAARGLIHRDIKPANLMIAHLPAGGTGPGDADTDLGEEEDGLLVKVIDFGIAKNVLDHAATAALTDGQPIGTPAFMSPEQITCSSDDPLDARTDIYSLGVTLWFLLTGQALFDGTDYQVFSQHATRLPPLEKLADAGAPPEVVALLRDMLAKNRDDRPADHGALIARLRRLLRRGGTAAEPAAPPLVLRPLPPREAPEGTPTVGIAVPGAGDTFTPRVIPRPRKQRRRLLLAVLVAVVLILALLLGRWLLGGHARLAGKRPVAVRLA